MKVLTENAYAKINLSLDVLALRPDGYHDLLSLMQTVSLCDVLTLTATMCEGIRVNSDAAFLPPDGKNLVHLAAQVFFRMSGLPPCGLCFHIQKNIPVGAGLGGGSADAAAALRLLDRLYPETVSNQGLHEIAQQVGADVPFCVLGGTQLAEGRGERLTRLSALPSCHIVLCRPPYRVSTHEAFSRWDRAPRRPFRPDHEGLFLALGHGDLRGLSRRMYNALEEVLSVARADVASIKGILLDHGALGAVMSGSGPTVLGLYDRRDAAKAAAAAAELSAQYQETFITQPV